MRRRDFISLLGVGAAWPIAAHAQQVQRIRRLAILMPAENDLETQARFMAFRQGLQDAGWTEGQNLRIDYRWAQGDVERIRSYAKEIIDLRPDVIVTVSNIATTNVSELTRTIPIVFLAASNPLETGLITNMARPGGNVTGFTVLESAITGKYLDLLKDITPHLGRVLVLRGADTPGSRAYLRTIDSITAPLAIETTVVSAATATEIEQAFEEFVSRGDGGGLIVLSSPTNGLHRKQIIALAAMHRVPAIYPYRNYATEGGLMSYRPDIVDQFRRAPSYIDRVLKGEKPGDLPVQFPTKFEMVVNLKTAKSLGLTVPPTLFARADEVIE